MIRFLVAAGLCLAVASARAEDRATWFKSLRQPGSGASCCDVSDCRRTHARFVAGRWTAELPDGDWIDVPDAAILQNTVSIDGDAYLCALKPTVYCFVRPDAGS